MSLAAGTPGLPTPPGSEESKSTSATPFQELPGMTATLVGHGQHDPMASANSFAGRRAQAEHLPAFSMPSAASSAGSYSSAPYSMSAQRPQMSSILTPSPGLSTDAPLSAGVNSVHQSQSYNYWPQSAPLQPSYPYSSSSQYPSRPTYSPSSSLPSRSAVASPTNPDMSHAQFPVNSGYGSAATSLPPMMSTAGQQQQGPLVSPPYNNYTMRPQGNSYFGNPTASSQPAHYSQYSQYPSQSPQQRLSPILPGSGSSLRGSVLAPGYPQYNSYSAPPRLGPVMTNAHLPGSNMSMFGGPDGHSVLNTNLLPPHPGPHAGYGAYNQQPPQNDKPFKCNECPQAFNRNHDLKRHQKIHLAIKPFPCTNCDKSFSRKDALKRHILVKGCGKKRSQDAELADFNSNGSNASDHNDSS